MYESFQIVISCQKKYTMAEDVVLQITQQQLSTMQKVSDLHNR